MARVLRGELRALRRGLAGARLDLLHRPVGERRGHDAILQLVSGGEHPLLGGFGARLGGLDVVGHEDAPGSDDLARRAAMPASSRKPAVTINSAHQPPSDCATATTRPDRQRDQRQVERGHRQDAINDDADL